MIESDGGFVFEYPLKARIKDKFKIFKTRVVRKLCRYIKYEVVRYPIFPNSDKDSAAQYDAEYRVAIMGIDTGVTHRDDGAACTYSIRSDMYYFFGQHYSEEIWEAKVAELKLRKLKL